MKKDKRGMFTSFWKLIRVRRRVMSFRNQGKHTMGMDSYMFVTPQPPLPNPHTHTILATDNSKD